MLVEGALEGLEVEVGVERQVLMRSQAEAPRAAVGQDAGEHHAQSGDEIVGGAAAKEGFAVGWAGALQRDQDRVA